MNRRAFIIESALAAAASLPVAVGAAEPKPPGIKVTILGNAWFPDDVMHLLVKDSSYAGHKDEAYRERADGSIDFDLMSFG